VDWARDAPPETVIGPLTQLLADHPLAEPVATQLIRALTDTGRRAEALACFAGFRARLADELGVEPGATLRELHQTILGQSVPEQLPPSLPGFVGRAAELSRLDEAAAVTPVIVIAGPAGVGKSSLTVQFARRLGDRYPDGRLAIDLRGFDPTGVPVEPAAALQRFLLALGVEALGVPVDVDAQMTLYRSRMAGRQMVVVLDNARDAEQVRPLLPGAPGSLVVITSRNQLTGLRASAGAHLLALGLLSTVEAEELLAARLGVRRVGAEPEAVSEIVELCGRLPLALAIAAARAAERPRLPLASVAAELRAARLESLSTGDPATDIRSVFSWSVRRLSPPAARLFRLLGPPPCPDISSEAAAALAGGPVRRALTELCAANLLTEHAPDRFAFHDLIHVYASELGRRGRRTPIARLLDHFLHRAHAAERTIDPGRDPILPDEPAFADAGEASRWLDAEHRCILATVEYAAAHGWDRHAWQLAHVVAPHLYRRGLWRDQVAVGRIAVAAAGRTGDPTARVLAAVDLARAHLQLDETAAAEPLLRWALELAGGVRQAETHHVLSWVLDLQHRDAEAFDHAGWALALYRDAGHRSGQARTLNTIGWFHGQRGRHREALSYCESALDLLLELGHRESQAATWHSLGRAHHRLGDHQQALSCYGNALAVFRELPNRYFEGSTLADIGDAHDGLGDGQAARSTWWSALAILEEIRHPQADGVRVKLGGKVSS
jgi:tetratricopeptide (TPR) repeat protein